LFKVLFVSKFLSLSLSFYCDFKTSTLRVVDDRKLTSIKLAHSENSSFSLLRKRKEAKVQESTDGVGKHFFLGVLSEDSTSEKAEQWAGRRLTRSPQESPKKMKNYACLYVICYD